MAFIEDIAAVVALGEPALTGALTLLLVRLRLRLLLLLPADLVGMLLRLCDRKWLLWCCCCCCGWWCWCACCCCWCR